MLIRTAALILLSCLSLNVLPQLLAEGHWVYFGTYTRGKSDSQGIYAAQFDLESGALSRAKLAVQASDPAFLAIHPTAPLLFAVTEDEDYRGEYSGAVSAYKIDAESGELTLINTQSSQGAHACHVSIDPSGSFVLVANYTGGNVASFRIEDDGSLSEALSTQQHMGSSINPKRQQGPHAHFIYPGPLAQSVYAADLGMDQILQYHLNDDGTLELVGSTLVEAGSGPRHMAFHPNGQLAFLINELSNTVTAYTIDSQTGSLHLSATVSSLPAGSSVKNSTAEIKVHPSGKFLYGSNRGHDSIVVYSIDTASGELTYVENKEIEGSKPRNFNIDPSGRYLLVAGQRSNTLEVFRINHDSGQLTATGHSIEVPSPACVTFLNRH